MNSLKKLIAYLDEIIYNSDSKDEIELVETIQKKLIDSHYIMMENRSLKKEIRGKN